MLILPLQRLFFMNKHTWQIILCGLLLACVPDSKERGYEIKRLAEKIKDRKIKKVTPRQLQTWVFQKGQFITELLNQNTDSNLRKKLQDSLQEAYTVTIQIISPNNRAMLDTAQGKRKAFLEALFYELEQSKPIEPNLQKLENENFLFVNKLFNHSQKAWLVEFTKQEAIRHIDPKELKKLHE